MLPALDELQAVRAIDQLMARRLHAMDTKDWAQYATLHAADAVMESFANFPDGARPVGTAADGRVVGRDAITAAIRSLMEEPVRMTSVHHVYSRDIVFPSATAAVRRQNIWRTLGRRLAESGPRLGVDVRRRACGAASADIRWSR